MSARLLIVMWALVLPALLSALPAGAKTVKRFTDCARLCPPMVDMPGGSYLMGAAPGADEKEGVTGDSLGRAWPQHRITIARFAMSATHVTRAQFAAFIRDTGHVMPDRCYVLEKNAPANWSFLPGEDPDHWGMTEVVGKGWWDPGFRQTARDPVVCVSWNDAQAYVQWLSSRTGQHYRLPTDAEWEYAARAGTTTVRFWGDDRASACRYANISDLTMLDGLGVAPSSENHFPCHDGYVRTSPGGHFRPNAFGLYDMIGNAWQWTQDCWNEDTNNIATTPGDGSAWMGSPCPRHVERGGGWGFNAWNTSSAYRNHNYPTSHAATIGFRVARDIPAGSRP